MCVRMEQKTNEWARIQVPKVLYGIVRIYTRFLTKSRRHFRRCREGRACLRGGLVTGRRGTSIRWQRRRPHPSRHDAGRFGRKLNVEESRASCRCGVLLDCLHYETRSIEDHPLGYARDLAKSFTRAPVPRLIPSRNHQPVSSTMPHLPQDPKASCEGLIRLLAGNRGAWMVNIKLAHTRPRGAGWRRGHGATGKPFHLAPGGADPPRPYVMIGEDVQRG